MFGRPVDYDTGNDPVVRVKAGKFARSWYSTTLKPKESTPSVFELPSGHYVPKFTRGFGNSGGTATRNCSFNSGGANRRCGSELSDERTEAKVDEAPHLPRKKSLHSLAHPGQRRACISSHRHGRLHRLKKWHRDSNTSRRFALSRFFPLENLSGDPGTRLLRRRHDRRVIADLGQVSTLPSFL